MALAGMKSVERSFADLEQESKKRKTGRERFLERIASRQPALRDQTVMTIRSEVRQSLAAKPPVSVRIPASATR